jgi:ribosome biogenesis GTPase A
MDARDSNRTLSAELKSALGMLELDKTSDLYRDAIALCRYLDRPTVRVAVFAPFNYGKSTLLNAILGEKALPIDLIPTTGAAIVVKFGERLHSCITLKDGTQVSEPGTKILKKYAILDDKRQMRNDVAEVEVTCPHPLLKTGVELMDLPGTDDREAQDRLVRDRLLTADLIVQVLDARKLMTLQERENLRGWLGDRGIRTVVFVVNFTNLLDPEEQRQVSQRMRLIAESFRSDLPDGHSNLYRVDALPALRAKLKGDMAASHASGLTEFESALQSVVPWLQAKTSPSRAKSITQNIIAKLENKKQAIAAELAQLNSKRQQQIEVKQKAQQLIEKGFQRSSSDFQKWLYLPKLLDRYQVILADALERGEFDAWEREIFQGAIAAYVNEIVSWMDKAGEFFPCDRPGKLDIPYPDPPRITIPDPPPEVKQKSNAVPVAIASGLGWALGGPVGVAMVGGATYFISEMRRKKPPSSLDEYKQQLRQAYAEAAKDYLTRFSREAFNCLYEYEKRVQAAIAAFDPTAEPRQTSAQDYQLQFTETLIDNLNRALSELGAVRVS